MDFYQAPTEQALKAFRALEQSGVPPTVTDQLLFAILAQLDQLNAQVEVIKLEMEN